MTFREILEDIYLKSEKDRLSYALAKYSELFPDDVIKYFLVRHSPFFSLPIFEYFNYINLNDYYIKSAYVSTEEVFSLVDYAPPCTFRDEDELAYKILDNGRDYWPNGTWSAPILVVKEGDKLLTIDGNNRLRMLRCYIRNSNKPASDKHEIYLLKKK